MTTGESASLVKKIEIASTFSDDKYDAKAYPIHVGGQESYNVSVKAYDANGNVVTLDKDAKEKISLEIAGDKVSALFTDNKKLVYGESATLNLSKDGNNETGSVTLTAQFDGKKDIMSTFTFNTSTKESVANPETYKICQVVNSKTDDKALNDTTIALKTSGDNKTITLQVYADDQYGQPASVNISKTFNDADDIITVGTPQDGKFTVEGKKAGKSDVRVKMADGTVITVTVSVTA